MQTMRAGVIAFTEMSLPWLFRTVNGMSLSTHLLNKGWECLQVTARLDQCKCNTVCAQQISRY